MLDYITQNKRAAKHISFLRRVLLQNLSGTLHIEFADGEQHQFLFYHGDFIGTEPTTKTTLRKFLTQQVARFAWEESNLLPKNANVFTIPSRVLTQALQDLTFEDERLIIYHQVFCQLPPVVLQDCLIHFFDFSDEYAYYLLHELSLDSPSFLIKAYFEGHTSRARITKRVRVLLLVYLLGYLRPASRKGAVSKKAQLAGRILKRF